jgi:GNAT superfamily N-acetyltransferase
MSGDRLQRMIGLAESFFDTKNDPAQLSITQEVIDRLRRIHPRSMTEVGDEEGPYVWIIVIPTTTATMEEFLRGAIDEEALLGRTLPGTACDALYLCSALVLPEFRGRGLALRAVCDAVQAIRKDHPLRTLYYWAFSEEGRRLAAAVGRETGLPVRGRMKGTS